jgi:ornithine cyclodeaminase/alanine dehydrogenase-like protein (mu-crystallin family)
MLIVSEAEVERLLDWTDVMAAMESALIAFSAGRVTQPVRSIVPVQEHEGLFGVMPAIYDGVIGTKLVTVFPGNAKRGLHTHNAVISLFRAETGEPMAMLGGRVITAWRTAAVSALATRELSSSDARVLGILGSGVQARSHLTALQKVRKFEEVRVWSRTREHAIRFAEDTGARVTSAEEAVRGADVIVTATGSPKPILFGEWLKPSAHVNAVGSVGSQNCEIDSAVMKRASVVVESREAASREAGEIVQSGASIYAELGELLSGTKKKPRDGITVYKSLGIAVEDVAAAKLVFQRKTRPPDLI